MNEVFEMSEEEKINVEEPDSISWGSASKDSQRKVYGNIKTAPVEMGRKVLIANKMKELALGEIGIDKFKEEVDFIKNM